MTSTPKPTMVVDDREPDWVAGKLEEYGISAPVAHMKWGDYALYPHGKTILIERKTISDLLSSISSKRLVAQMHGVRENSDKGFLLREGQIRKSPNGQLSYFSPKDPRRGSDGWVDSGWAWSSFNGIMLDIQLLGIGVIDCPVMGEFVGDLAQLATNLYKDTHKWLKDRGRPEVLTLDTQYRNSVWALCAFDGIGPEIAEGLLRECGTIYEVISQAAEWPDTLANKLIKGKKLGKKRAMKLHEEVTAKW